MTSDPIRGCRAGCPLRAASPSGPADPSRRLFVSQTVLASVSAFLAACGDGNIGGITGTGGIGGPPPPPGGALVVTLADFPGLAADGGMARVDGGSGTPIAVTRISAASYLAFSMICPHAGFRPINIVPGFGYACPNHGAEFQPDGDWSGGQPTTDLDQYTVVLNAGAGTLSIT